MSTTTGTHNNRAEAPHLTASPHSFDVSVAEVSGGKRDRHVSTRRNAVWYLANDNLLLCLVLMFLLVKELKDPMIRQSKWHLHVAIYDASLWTIRISATIPRHQRSAVESLCASARTLFSEPEHRSHD